MILLQYCFRIAENKSVAASLRQRLSATAYSSRTYQFSLFFRSTKCYPYSFSSRKLNTPILYSSNNPQKSSETKMGILDLEKHFAFYGAYHSNPVNVLIHMVFVWPIFFTALIPLYFTPPILNASPIHSILVLNYGFLFTLVYGIFYLALDKKAGSLAALLCFLCWVFSSSLAHNLGFSLSWKVALAAQLICWTSQFIGHGMFEKRAPALLDNLTQALLMAPFFVLLEVLQSFFGYEPYPGFHAKVKAKIDADIKEWKEKKQE